MKESNLVVNRVNPFDDADTPTPASPPPLPPPDEVAPPEVVPFHMTQDSPQSGANDIIQMIPTYEEPQGADYPERKLMQRDGILGQLTMSRGDFNLGEKLGSGAGGIVYRGMLGSTPIAVKELIEESSEAREEFLQEAVIMGSLKHSRVRATLLLRARSFSFPAPRSSCIPPTTRQRSRGYGVGDTTLPVHMGRWVPQ
jgi:hypothetical protein